MANKTYQISISKNGEHIQTVEGDKNLVKRVIEWCNDVENIHATDESTLYDDNGFIFKVLVKKFNKYVGVSEIDLISLLQ